MDELLTKAWKDEFVRWRIIFIVLNAFFSVLCIFITQNVVVSSLFVVGIAIIDILVEISKYINLKKLIKKLFSINIYWYYIGFVFLASLPTILGLLKKEIEVQKNLLSIVFVNMFSNILGALIVCSIINHISKFNYEQIIYSLIKKKKNYINIFIRIGFLGCFLNSANYEVNEKWNSVNFANSIYLFVIIFCGVVVFSSFVIRIIDNNNFDYTFEEVFPKMTLYIGELFLISCGVEPLFFRIGKHEPILLAMNSITACIIVIFLAVFISRRTENATNKYPFKSIIAFILIACANCGYNFYKWDKSGNWSQQIFSGVSILIFVLALLLWANKIQKSENKTLK